MRALDDLEENAVDVRSEMQRMVRAMESHGGPFRRPGRTFGLSSREEIDLSMLPAADGTTLSALKQDQRFIGPVRSHQFAVALYVRELKELLLILDSILDLLDRAVDEP